jgi:hypothetical protein
MAISTENANKVWQKVKIHLDAQAASPAAVAAFKTLKQVLSQDKRNPDLQVVVISDLTADAVIADAACRVRGLYLKKQATATGAFVKASDHASATSATAPELLLELNEASKESFLIWPDGWSQGTGFTIGSDTTSDGSTSTTSGDGPKGFAIISAP